ncbi:MAG: glutamate racemase [Gemmatimonadaceae bacterium]
MNGGNEQREFVNKPIGVFDSGLGGLTVVRALLSELPNESIVYFGDTARVPYGPKSAETVRRYALQIGEWLVTQGVKAIVVACNTATAHALNDLRNAVSVPVIGVIEPGARAAVNATRGNAIGVIGTSGTIASGAYERAIKSLAPSLRVETKACPLLVPLVEEGWTDHAATRLVIHEYLAPLRAAEIDTLVLGCTHYPLLAPMLAAEAGATVQLIDSARETALETARLLRDKSWARAENSTPIPTHRFVASDAPDHFLTLGRRFLGDAIERVEHVTFA